MRKKVNTETDDGRSLGDDYIYRFQTHDLGCATALICSGFRLIGLDKSNPRKAQFIFQREAGIEGVADTYWSSKLKVQARAFFDNLKMLKNRLYSE